MTRVEFVWLIVAVTFTLVVHLLLGYAVGAAGEGHISQFTLGVFVVLYAWLYLLPGIVFTEGFSKRKIFDAAQELNARWKRVLLWASFYAASYVYWPVFLWSEIRGIKTEEA